MTAWPTVRNKPPSQPSTRPNWPAAECLECLQKCSKGQTKCAGSGRLSTDLTVDISVAPRQRESAAVSRLAGGVMRSRKVLKNVSQTHLPCRKSGFPPHLWILAWLSTTNGPLHASLKYKEVVAVWGVEARKKKNPTIIYILPLPVRRHWHRGWKCMRQSMEIRKKIAMSGAKSTLNAKFKSVQKSFKLRCWTSSIWPWM